MGTKARRIWAFVKKDMVESIKNRSIFIAVILPVLASLLFGVLDTAQTPKNFAVAILDKADSGFAEFVQHAALNFEVQHVAELAEGKDLVGTGEIDGFIVVKENDYFRLFLDSKRPVYFFALRENITNLIEVFLQEPPRYDLEINPVGEGRVSQSVLPVWITITMTMIGIMVVSGMFAEEKDHKTLDAIGVSPVGYGELLIGKGVFGVLLSLGTVGIMLLLNRVFGLSLSSWLALLCLSLSGGVCFTALGLLIGVASSGQSAARSIATMIYFPLLFPTLIADLSEFTRLLASVFPTFYVFTGLEAILLHNKGLGGIGKEIAIVFSFALALLGITFAAHKRMVNAND